uniref:GAE domain-containing protein n=1 Tax=Macrostomum lignano TaxID=282301 RepID=A0A1I8FKD0_9PLAT
RRLAMEELQRKQRQMSNQTKRGRSEPDQRGNCAADYGQPYAKEDAEDELPANQSRPCRDAIARCQAAASAVGDGGCRGPAWRVSSSTASLASIVSSSSGDMLIELEGVRTAARTLTLYAEFADALLRRTTTKSTFTVNNVATVSERENVRVESLAMALPICAVDEGQQQQLVNGGESTHAGARCVSQSTLHWLR